MKEYSLKIKMSGEKPIEVEQSEMTAHGPSHHTMHASAAEIWAALMFVQSYKNVYVNRCQIESRLKSNESLLGVLGAVYDDIMRGL